MRHEFKMKMGAYILFLLNPSFEKSEISRVPTGAPLPPGLEISWNERKGMAWREEDETETCLNGPDAFDPGGVFHGEVGRLDLA